MVKKSLIVITFIITLLSFAFCEEKNEIKIVIFNKSQKEFLEIIASCKNYDMQIIDNGNYWTIKNASEEILLEIASILCIKKNVISDNIANVDTTRTADGGPYIRKYLKITVENGVEIIDDMENNTIWRYDPTHPDAIKTGERQDYVEMPNVNIVKEMSDMIDTSRLYDAVIAYLKEKYNCYII